MLLCLIQTLPCECNASAAAAAVNPYGIKNLLANGLCTFPIKGNPVFSNGTKSLPRNSPDCSFFAILQFYIS